MMIGQHLTAISPDTITNGGTYVAIGNPDTPSVVYGSANPGSQQQRIGSSSAQNDVNNNEVNVTSGNTMIDGSCQNLICLFFIEHHWEGKVCSCDSCNPAKPKDNECSK